MWLMFPGGIVMPSLRPAHKIPAGDTRQVQIRARRREHLSRFRREYMPGLAATIELPKTDYEFRAYCSHEELAVAFMRVALDVNYVKFKPETESQYDDKELHGVYNSIWGVVSRLSSDDHRWGSGWNSWPTSGEYDRSAWAGYGSYGKTGVADEQPAIEGGANAFIGPEEYSDIKTLGQLYELALALPVTTKSVWWDTVGELLADIEKAKKCDHTACDHQATAVGDRWCDEDRFGALMARFHTLEMSMDIDDAVVEQQ